jgi:lactate racemase
MQTAFLCGRESITVNVPDGSAVYESSHPEPSAGADVLVARALVEPVGAPTLVQALRARRPGDVVIVVSDITRPIPYARFLPQMLARIESAGVPRAEILILIATGMHRPSTPAEHIEMFGAEVAAGYCIRDHNGESDAELVELPGASWSGARVRLNRHFVEAGFRITTGLVEPHFMAGFSGGRKAVCPGLAALETVRNFHGEAFLADPRACNANLVGNPLHEEALSVARMVGVDFTLGVVLDNERRVVRAFAGELEAAHAAACDFVRVCACPSVETPADVVITSSGGYPLDATFYQCIKGLVSCLPAVRDSGEIITFGGCSEGIGGAEYTAVMQRYADRWQDFVADIKRPEVFTKDQWQFQMHARTLAKVGQGGLHFITDGLPQAELARLSVAAHAVAAGAVQAELQRLADAAVAAGKTIAVFPEGPYCAPVTHRQNPS